MISVSLQSQCCGMYKS